MIEAHRIMSIWFVLVIVLVPVFALLLYWQLVVAEGAYLGKRTVALLYDLFAPRYDAVKQFNPISDAILLAEPILRSNPNARVLDIATGTGRLPLTLFLQPRFTGSIVAIDASKRMLAVAEQKLAAYADRLTLLHQDAQQLPFEDEAFDVATCLEALEFMPDWRETTSELCRVLKPGGLMILSNRIGPDAWKLPGRAMTTQRLIAVLSEMSLTQIVAQEWLVDYDLVIAHKIG
jgi:ubiquinone/menaquinone biosynthesis C-methylase UbiE